MNIPFGSNQVPIYMRNNIDLVALGILKCSLVFSSATAPLQAAAQPTEEDSQELQLLKINWKVMITAMTFDVSWMAGEMNRTGLLSDNDYHDVIKVQNLLNDTEKGEIMLTSLKKKVTLNPKHLSTFKEILMLIPRRNSDAIDILNGK